MTEIGNAQHIKPKITKACTGLESCHALKNHLRQDILNRKSCDKKCKNIVKEKVKLLRIWQ